MIISFLLLPGSLQRLTNITILPNSCLIDLHIGFRFLVRCRKITFIYLTVQISGEVFYKSLIVHFLAHHSNNIHLCQFSGETSGWENRRAFSLPFHHRSGSLSFQQRGSKDWMRMCGRTLSTISTSLSACLSLCLPVWLSLGIASQFSPGSEGKSVYPRTTLTRGAAPLGCFNLVWKRMPDSAW